MLGWMPRNVATITSPRMPNRRLAAKESSVSRKVTSRIRAGIKYEWSWLALGDIAVDCTAVKTLLFIRRHHAAAAECAWGKRLEPAIRVFNGGGFSRAPSKFRAASPLKCSRYRI